MADLRSPLVQTYRDLLAGAARAARRYTGAEGSFADLIRQGDTVDVFLSQQAGNRVTGRDPVERDFAACAGLRIQTVSDVLDIASRRFNALAQQLAHEEVGDNVLERGGGVVVETGLYFLPTDRRAPETGSGTGWNSGSAQPRLAMLLEGLQRKGIFTDDLILHKGRRQPGQMRERPYHIVEIPRLGAQIAVCDWVGEVTLVSTSRLPVGVWASGDKASLKLLPGVHAVRFTNPQEWFAGIWAHLSPQSPLRPKVNVQKEATRKRERNTFPLSEEFILHHARLYQETHGGEAPTTRSGPVEGLEGETWFNWHNYLRKGVRGLPGGPSLRKLFLKAELICNVDPDQVLTYARAYQVEHDGRLPHAGLSIAIAKGVSLTWAGVNARFREGLAGFPLYPGGLKEFLRRMGLIKEVTLDDVPEYVRAYQAEHGGRLPHGGLSVQIAKGISLTWGGLNHRLHDGLCDFPKYEKGLSGFLIEAGFRPAKNTKSGPSQRQKLSSAATPGMA